MALVSLVPQTWGHAKTAPIAPPSMVNRIQADTFPKTVARSLNVIQVVKQCKHYP